jgi:uncharacterized repeat protein (TIGR01451 family)
MEKSSTHGPAAPVVACLLVLTLALMGNLTAGHAVERAAVVPQETLTLYADMDATIKADEPDRRFGGETELQIFDQVVMGPSPLTYVLIHFDVSSIPAEAVVDSATLQLYLWFAAGADPIRVEVYGVQQSWSESDVTWNSQPYVETGGYVYGVSVDSVPGWKAWAVSGFVNAWRSGANYGLELRAPPIGLHPWYYDRKFRSKDGSVNLPRLNVTYHLPATPTGTATRTPTRTATRTPTGTPTRTATCTATALPQPQARLAKALIDPSGGEATVGDIIRFELRVDNTGPTDITVLPLADNFHFNHECISYQAANPPPDLVIQNDNEHVLRWYNEGTLHAGSRVTFLVEFRAEKSCGEVRNRVLIYNAVDEHGSPVQDQLADATVRIIEADATATPTSEPQGEADLELTKDGPASPVLPGSVITYTLVITNRGPLDTSLVVVTDTLPAAVSYLSCWPSNGHCRLGISGPPHDVVRWEQQPGDVMPSGRTETLRIVARVDEDSCGLIHNEAEALSDLPDPDLDDNTAELETEVGPCEGTATATATSTRTPTRTPTATPRPTGGHRIYLPLAMKDYPLTLMGFDDFDDNGPLTGWMPTPTRSSWSAWMRRGVVAGRW